MPSFKGGPPEVLELAVATSMHQATGLDAPAADPYRPDWLLHRWEDGQLKCSVGYAVAGMLDDETFVVRVAANYGGTASVLKVLVIRVHLGPKLFDDEPAPVVMTLERILPLPGLDATFEIDNNTVTISRPAREGVRADERTHVIRP